MDELIFDQDSQESLKKWITDRTKTNYPESVCIGLARDGELIACVAYQNFEKCIYAHIALEKPLTKNYLNVIFDYPFNQVKQKKLIVLIEEENKKSINLAERLGFRKMHHDKTMVYQMTKNECKWIKE